MRNGCAILTAMLFPVLQPVWSAPPFAPERDVEAAPLKSLADKAVALAFQHSYENWRKGPKTPAEKEAEKLGCPCRRTREQFYCRFFAGDPFVPREQIGPFVPPDGYFAGYLAALHADRSRQICTQEVFAVDAMRAMVKARVGNGIVKKEHVDLAENLLEERLKSANHYAPDFGPVRLEMGLPETAALEFDEEIVRPIDDWIRLFARASADFRSAVHAGKTAYRPNQTGKLRGQLREILTSSDLVSKTAFRDKARLHSRTWKKSTDEKIVAALRSLREELARFQNKIDAEELLDPAERQRRADVKTEIGFAVFEQALRVFEAAAWRRSPKDRQAQAEKSCFLDVYRSLTNLLMLAYNDRLALAEAAQPPLPEAFVKDLDLANNRDDDLVMKTVSRMAQKGLTVQAARDDASYNARFAVRNLRVAAFNYRRVQVRQLSLAYLVVDQSLLILADEMDAATRRGTEIDKLLMQQRQSQRSMSAAKMDVYGIWLSYLTARMNLCLSVGLMRLDENGHWLDNMFVRS